MSKQEKCKCARNYGILEHGFELTEGVIQRAKTHPHDLILRAETKKWGDYLKRDVAKVSETCEIDLSRLNKWLDIMKLNIEDGKYDIARSDLESIKLEVSVKIQKCSLGEE